MAKAAADPLAKQKGETAAQWKMRLALAGVLAKDEDETRKVPNPFVQMHGDYRDRFVTHVETNTKAKAFQRRDSHLVARWLDEGGPHFPPGARTAIEHCQTLWEACPLLGKQTATYSPPTASGERSHESLFNLDAQRELAVMAGWFPGPYWKAFELAVRDGEAAIVASKDLSPTPSTAIAMLKAVVGMIACHIAARRGW